MVKTTQPQHVSKRSSLDQFALFFEYDMTLQQVKQDMRLRTLDLDKD